MAVMEPFFFFFNNLVFFLVLIATSVAVNLQFEKNEILTGDVKRSEDKKPEFTDVVTNQTVVAGRQEQYGKVAPGKTLLFREAVLSCHVSHLGSYKVAWVRVDTQTILTIHNSIITRWHRLPICITQCYTLCNTV